MRDDDTVIPIDPDLSPTDPGEPVLGRRGHLPRRRHGRARPDVLAVIALGGMLGAAARFKLAEALPTEEGHFPWATFWTNLSGSFLLGFLLILLLERFPPTRYVRPFLATGILGAFTTMSTYTVETALLIKDGPGPRRCSTDSAASLRASSSPMQASSPLDSLHNDITGRAREARRTPTAPHHLHRRI